MSIPGKPTADDPKGSTPDGQPTPPRAGRWSAEPPAPPAAALQRKIDLLIKHFGTQRSKQWFDEDTFRGLARLRGMECRAPERFAEAFFGRKMLFA